MPGGQVKNAVVDLALGIKHGECFGMLGPNGAGKTTTINMLCGMFLPTSGKATFHTKDLVDDIKEIQKVMGVCPQHDLLWGSLTGVEHLLFYGRLRGLSGDELQLEVRKGLADVSLTFAAKKASKTYSGGMKRRLSVACCLIGKPKIVYLDEPSTGLDPASRRKLWDVIRRASKVLPILLSSLHNFRLRLTQLRLNSASRLRTAP
jgi:ABC-type multidrug transport system ATPase subunit